MSVCVCVCMYVCMYVFYQYRVSLTALMTFPFVHLPFYIWEYLRLVLYSCPSTGLYGPKGHFSETNALCQTRSETEI